MIERELAWRVFAHEFNHSDHFFHEGDERAPNYLVTPTGAKINRLYFVGVLTEIDNIGVGEDMWRGRLSDPTGAFTVYAGQYQPEAAMFLAGLEIPSFVALVGKARTYEPEEGSVFTSVRPEELNTANASIRDRWIVDTARLTLERIRLVRAAQESGLKGEELIASMVRSGANPELASGISMAIEHYADLDSYLDTLSVVIIEALKTLLPDDDIQPVKKNDIIVAEVTGTQYQTDAPEKVEQAVPVMPVDAEAGVKEDPAGYSIEEPGVSQEQVTEKPEITKETEVEPEIPEATEITVAEENEPDADEIIYDLLGKLDSGKGVPVAELIENSINKGLNEDQIDEAVKALMSEGKCYEPRIGLLRRV
jgi:RPA family protein